MTGDGLTERILAQPYAQSAMDTSEKNVARLVELQPDGGRRWLPRVVFRFCLLTALLLMIIFQAEHALRPLTKQVSSSRVLWKRKHLLIGAQLETSGPLARPCSASSGFPGCSFQEHWSNRYEFRNLSRFSLGQFIGQSYRAVDSGGHGEHQIVSAEQHDLVNGTITFLSGQSHQAADVEVYISVNASDSWIIDWMQIEHAETAFGAYFPNPALYQYCFEYSIDVYIHPGLQLEELELRANWAHVHINDELPLSISSSTVLQVGVGSVTSDGFFYSPHSHVSVSNGLITGNYTLERSLQLESAVGEIVAQIAPNSSRTIEGESGCLTLATNVGAIDVAFPYSGFGHLAERDYITNVEGGKSGQIRGQYLLGSQMEVKAQAASIDIDVLPYLITNTTSLSTETTTGDLWLCMLVPEHSGIESIGNLISNHVSTTGSMDLQYPRQWEGTLHGQIAIGQLDIEGDFDKILKSKNGLLGEKVFAQRGEGHSDVRMSTTTGQIAFNLI